VFTDPAAELVPFLVKVALSLNFVAAVATAAHAAMYKRDPKAAMGFILAAFTLPFVGPIFYWLFGVNRIRRRRLAALSRAGPRPEPVHREAALFEAQLIPLEAVELKELVHMGRQVTGRPLLAGNLVEPLANGEEAYPAMLQAIDAARKSVNLSTYLFIGDATGRKFTDALANARARGVEVQVLIDGLGERYSWRRARRLLKGTGVKSAKFVPPIPLWRGAYINLRNHRKILVVDGEVGFTGGINIGDRHLAARTENPHRVRDLHFRLRGPIVAELQEVFIDDWWFVTGERLGGEAYFPRLTPAGHALCRGVSDGPDADQEQLRHLLLGAIACARRRVQIMTPYFIPDRSTISALITTALRGVEVELILPRKSNIPFFHWAMMAYLWELLRHGVKVYLDSPPFNHAKALVVDGVWVLLGSANLDPRSLRLNFEFCVEVYDSALGRRLSADLDAAAGRSHPLTLEEVDSRSLPVRLRDGLAKLFSPYL
jgi:cardiolipin synthase